MCSFVSCYFIPAFSCPAFSRPSFSRPAFSAPPLSTNIQQTQPDPNRKQFYSCAVAVCICNYFQTSITVPRMHVKIIANMRHKSEHSINIKLASITCRSSCHRTSSTASQGSCGSLKVLELDFLTRRDRTSDCYHQMRFLGCNATELR